MNTNSENTKLFIEMKVPQLPFNTETPSREELTLALLQTGNRKAAENTILTEGLLEIDIAVAADMFLQVIQKIWQERTFPNDWKEDKRSKFPIKESNNTCTVSK